MAVSPVAGVTHWVGLSTDTKPTGVRITPGSTFRETDTGLFYMLGPDGWFQAPQPLLSTNGETLSTQYPLPVDGDSVYAKDIDVANSDIGDFTGSIEDLFNDYTNANVADAVGSGGVNPKSFKIVLQRPVVGSLIGLGSSDTSLSNAKLILRGLDGNTIKEVDQSADSTKRGVLFFSFEQTGFIEAEILFYTDDAVSVGGCAIFKSRYTTIGAIDGLLPIDLNTTTPLLANATYTSGIADTKNYGIIVVSTYSDVASATDGLVVEFSTDKINWFWDDVFTKPAGKGKTESVQPQAQYMRIRYTNGPVDQTVFHLQTQIKPVYIKPSSHRIADNISGQDDGELVKSVISGEDDNGVFQNVKTDLGGLLRVNSFPYTYGIAEGDILGHYPLLKFGTRTTVAANTPSTVWEGPTALYTYLSSAEQLKIASTDNVNDNVGGTGALTLTVHGLDANWDEVSETVTMTGTTQVTTTASFIRVYRAFVATSGTSYTNTGTITIKNNAATITLAIINIGEAQTLMTLWTVPAGHIAYLTSGTFSTDSNKGARVSLFTRLNDGGTLYPWQIKYRAYTFSGNELFPFQIPFPIPGKTDIEVRVNTPASAGSTSAGATFELWYELV